MSSSIVPKSFMVFSDSDPKPDVYLDEELSPTLLARVNPTPNVPKLWFWGLCDGCKDSRLLANWYVTRQMGQALSGHMVAPCHHCSSDGWMIVWDMDGKGRRHNFKETPVKIQKPVARVAPMPRK